MSAQSLPDQEKHLTETPTEPRRRPPFYYLTIANLALCVFIATVNDINFAAAVPAVAEAFGATSGQAYWCSTVLLLSQCVSQPIYGVLAEVLGRRACILLSLAIFAAASLLAALSQSIVWLIAARAIEGLGIGGVNVCVNIIVSDLAPIRERAKLSGMLSAFGALGLVAGVTSGAAAAEHWWRIIFWINLPVAVCAFIIFVFFLRLDKDDERRPATQALRELDWIGILLLSSSTAGVLFGLTSGGTVYPWKSLAVIASLTIGGAGIVLFGLYEQFLAGQYGLAFPFLPLKLFGSRTAASGYVIAFIHGAVLWALPYYYLLYIHICASKSLIQSSVLVLPSLIMIPIAAGVAGITITRLAQFKYINIFANATIAGGLAGLATLRADPTIGQILGYQFLFSIGGGILFPGRLIQVQAAQTRKRPSSPQQIKPASEDKEMLMATSLVSFLTSLGQAFGIAVGSTVLQNAWGPLVDQASLDGQLPASVNGTSFIIPASQAAQVAEIIVGYPSPIAEAYRSIAAQSIARVWEVCVGFAVLGVLAGIASRNIRLTNEF